MYSMTKSENKILISEDIVEKVKQYSIKDIISVAVFFDNPNFISTKYKPINNSVNLIIELQNKTQLHIRNCNCGYRGTGQHNTYKVLKALGFNDSILEKYVFGKKGFIIYLEDGDITDIVTENLLIFGSNLTEIEEVTRIKLSESVRLDWIKNELLIINPQANDWIGFLRLLKSINCKTIEYYVGENSPIGNYMRLESSELNRFKYIDAKMFYKAGQVNIAIYSEKIKVYCFIDRSVIKQVVNSLMLLFKKPAVFLNSDTKSIIKRLISNNNTEIHEVVSVNDK